MLRTFDGNEDREQFYHSLRGVVVDSEARHHQVTADDLRSVAVVSRVSSVVLAALLFVVGFYWARFIGGDGWRAGLVMMLSCMLLVEVAIAFGG